MLRLDHVTKRFGSTLAVDDVTLTIAPGEIVGLVGENGAGKSTLMRIAAGEIAADSGSVERPPAVGFVHQHFALVPHFTIAENLALPLERRFRLLTRRRAGQIAQSTIDASGIALTDPSRLAATLAVGEKAKLELIKAVSGNPEVLILDEPTSVLTPVETGELFALMRRLAAAGTAVVFISHKVPEVREIAQRIVVMRRGRIVVDSSGRTMTPDDIAAAMIGSVETAPHDGGPVPVPHTDQVLRVDDVRGEILDGATLRVRRNEIVAIAGVSGNGQSELVEVLRGAKSIRGGQIDVATSRIAFIPEDRTRDALVPQMTIAENLALGSPRWNRKSAESRAASLISLYGIRARGPRQLAGELSGGNQQKVILARELDRKPELIVAAEPTRGLDIEATRFVQNQLRAAARAGAGILLITSDLDEAFALAGVIHVIYRGRLSPAMPPEEARARIARLMAGIA